MDAETTMRHYCTYFDRGFLIQGLALWRSLRRHDPLAVLWVLALDEETADLLRGVGDADLRVVPLAELEAGDPRLAATRGGRSRVEYYFTLSPCWPRWLLASRPEISRITYLDADLFFFADAEPVFREMDEAGASVLVTAHRFAPWLRHYERHGLYNVGVLVFRRDEAGLACLDDWRARCLEWCHDRLEAGRYADQKYLDAWPALLGARLRVSANAGLNLAPWNWAGHRCSVDENGRAWCDGAPLVVFHFARLRPIVGDWWWQSGQADYGVMPRRLRDAVYGPYWRALDSARAELARLRPGFDFTRRPARLGRDFWRGLPLRVIFGSDWLRVGGHWISGRAGLGRWSGYVLARLRRIFLRA